MTKWDVEIKHTDGTKKVYTVERSTISEARQAGRLAARENGKETATILSVGQRS